MKQHQKKYYGSLVFITVLILATAVVLQEYGLKNFGKGDLVGMVTETINLTTNNENTGIGEITSATYESGGTFTIIVNENEYRYKIVYIEDEPYAEWFSTDNTVYYTDKNAIMYTENEDGDLQKVDINKGMDTSLMNSETSSVIQALTEAFAEFDKELVSIEFADAKAFIMTEAQKQEYQRYAEQIAQQLGVTSEEAYQIVVGEREAINSYIYLYKEAYNDIQYDPTTGYYSGTTSDGTVIFHDEEGNTGTMVTTKVTGGTTDVYIIKNKAGFGKATYSSCAAADIVDGICGDPQPYKGETEGFSDAINGARDAEEDIEEAVQDEMERCKKATIENPCQLTYDQVDTKKSITTTARMQAYQNMIYQQQENQVRGLLTGWLNNFIDKKLGGWSRGVPAGICAHILNFEYYKQDGWTRVPSNSSAEQLQSKLIANSRTVIIEGEKEEITVSLFRYAYTIKLLANQSIEWQTYLYNSCSGKTSVEQFYDYGYLAAGSYFSFHYAGAGDVDMIFDCTKEDCLYDQACVVFTDGTPATCVSLVHGAGFETPNAGSDYDCV